MPPLIPAVLEQHFLFQAFKGVCLRPCRRYKLDHSPFLVFAMVTLQACLWRYQKYYFLSLWNINRLQIAVRVTAGDCRGAADVVGGPRGCVEDNFARLVLIIFQKVLSSKYFPRLGNDLNTLELN